MLLRLLSQGDLVEDQLKLQRRSFNHPRNRIHKRVKTIKNSSWKVDHYQPRLDRELFQLRMDRVRTKDKNYLIYRKRILRDLTILLKAKNSQKGRMTLSTKNQMKMKKTTSPLVQQVLKESQIIWDLDSTLKLPPVITQRIRKIKILQRKWSSLTKGIQLGSLRWNNWKRET